MGQDRRMTLSDAQRELLATRLRVIELWLAVIDDRGSVATMIGPAQSKPEEVAAVAAALSCSEADADQVLGLQLRRFTEVSRIRLLEERSQLLTDLDATAPKAIVPSAVSTSAGRQIYTRPTAPVQSRPLSDDERAERRRRHEDDRARSLMALAQAAKDWKPVADLVHSAPDDDAAKALLIAQFGWGHAEAQTVFDMQLRVLSAWSQQRIEAELEGIV